MERLVINRDGVHPTTKKPLYDANGNPLGTGSFFIKGNTLGFEKELLFRPIDVFNRYFYYDAAASRYDGETILFQSKWDEAEGKFTEEEAIDNKGTIRLGRPGKGEFEKLDPMLQQMWRQKAKWQVCIFGLAYLNHLPKPVTVEFNAAGRVGVQLSSYINKNKRPLHDNILRLFLTDNNGNIQPTFEKFASNPEDASIMNPALEEVKSYVKEYNDKIRKLHEDVLIKKGNE